MASTTNNSFTKFPRRTSVTPAATQFSRSSTDAATGGRSTSFNRRSSSQNADSGFSPADKLRRMSMLFSIDKTRTRDAILAALEDPARTEYRRLKYQNEHLLTEWKQLKKFIEQLQTDYESSRQLDPFRRFKQLQAMTKRTVMHLRLTEVGSVNTDSSLTSEVALQGSVVQSEAKEREIEKRITQLCDSSTQRSCEEVERQMQMGSTCMMRALKGNHVT
ncbi:unnamed protein product [Echinostoma caproni]|uniref:Uncharacterized protein n=1 Tax=Echinostoma caproni TaxID=27848 RepID=A0A183A8M3_9TREM|nr:unnamed protein product [Echinostoma caproni]